MKIWKLRLILGFERERSPQDGNGRNEPADFENHPRRSNRCSWCGVGLDHPQGGLHGHGGTDAQLRRGDDGHANGRHDLDSAVHGDETADALLTPGGLYDLSVPHIRAGQSSAMVCFPLFR